MSEQNLTTTEVNEIDDAEGHMRRDIEESGDDVQGHSRRRDAKDADADETGDDVEGHVRCL